MNHATVVLLIIAAVFAVGNWVSRLIDSRVLEYFTKPTVTVLLAGAALTIDPRSASARPWFVAGLLLSLAGDVFLMLPEREIFFVFGLGSFLLAHVAYIVGFGVADLGFAGAVATAVVVAAVMAPLASTILRSVRARAPALRIPVTLYICVIGVMIVFAGGSGIAIAILGAATFAFSDSLIAWTKFVQPLKWASVAIMVTYHLGQVGILVSLAK